MTFVSHTEIGDLISDSTNYSTDADIQLIILRMQIFRHSLIFIPGNMPLI